LLTALREEGTQGVFSHDLAVMAGVTAAQVRRDIMSLGYCGSPAHGYDVDRLIESIRTFLDAPEPEPVVLAGVGNLGRAILSYFAGRRPNLVIVAAFDSDPQKVNRTISGCPCHGLDELPGFVTAQGIRIAVMTVPTVAAQPLAETLVRAGIRGILNFAPVPLRVPENTYVEQMDMTMSLEKVAFFARQRSEREVVR
jgi:redox-sensing transcriptional repressor